MQIASLHFVSSLELFNFIKSIMSFAIYLLLFLESSMQTLEELGYSDRFGEVNKSKSQSLL